MADAEYRIIYGVHIVGPHATELIGEAVLAMQLEYTTEELAASIRIHPTFSEAVVDAARDAEKWALYLPKNDRYIMNILVKLSYSDAERPAMTSLHSRIE